MNELTEWYEKETYKNTIEKRSYLIVIEDEFGEEQNE